jgi:hypothetical protein
MYKIRKDIEDNLRNVRQISVVCRVYEDVGEHALQELDHQGFICPRCNKSFTMLQVDQLMDPSGQAFICDVCYTELVDNHDSEEVVQSKNKMNRYFSQTANVIEGLKKADQVVLPAYVFETRPYLRSRISSDWGVRGLRSHRFNIEKFIEDTMPSEPRADVITASGSGKATVVGVEMAKEEDEVERRAQAEAKVDALRSVVPGPLLASFCIRCLMKQGPWQETKPVTGLDFAFDDIWRNDYGWREPEQRERDSLSREGCRRQARYQTGGGTYFGWCATCRFKASCWRLTCAGTANEFESWYRSQNVSSVATPLSTTSPATPGLLGSGGASETSDEEGEQDGAAFETVAVNGNGKRTHARAEFVEPTVKRVKSEDEEAVDRLSLDDTVTVKGVFGMFRLHGRQSS